MFLLLFTHALTWNKKQRNIKFNSQQKPIRSNRSDVLYRTSGQENLAKFTEKHLWWVPFQNKIVSLVLQIY